MRHFLLISVISFLLPLVAWSSDEVEPVGHYGQWRIYTAQEKNGTVCFMVVSPQQTNLKREDNYLAVTRRPYENAYDEISVMLGTNYHKTSKPTIGVDNKKVIAMEPYENTAFIRDKAIETQLIQDMISGNVVRTQSKSVKGQVLRETFSLKGFSKAYEALELACPKK